MHHSTPKQGGPFQQLLPIQCYRVLRALRLRGLGPGYVPLGWWESGGQPGCLPVESVPPAGPAVHCKGISDPRQCHDVRMQVCCAVPWHGMFRREGAANDRHKHRSLPASLSFRCQCRCRRAGAHVAEVQVQVPQRQCPWDCLGLRAPRTARSSRTAAWVTRVGPLADDPG